MWAELSEDNKACGIGHEQSPIDIKLADVIPADFADVEIHWKPFEPVVTDNGHTIQINTDGMGGYALLGGVPYDLLQFHFHHLSEHTLDGEHTPMEVHFVHKSKAGDLLVLGVLLRQGDAEEPTIATVWPLVPGPHEISLGSEPIDATTMLPAEFGSFRYAGSLTTPPCSEVVTWNVFADPVYLSESQIQTYRDHYENNYRPVQSLYRRLVLAEGISE